MNYAAKVQSLPEALDIDDTLGPVSVSRLTRVGHIPCSNKGRALKLTLSKARGEAAIYLGSRRKELVVASDSAWLSTCDSDLESVYVPHRAEFTNVSFDEKVFEAAQEIAHVGQVRFVPRLNFHDGVLRHLTYKLASEASDVREPDALLRETLQLSLATYLLNAHTESRQQTTVFRGGLSGALLRRCINYIEDRIDGEVTLDELAKTIGISKFHLLRCFKQSTGSTPYDFVISRRIERAKRMISQGKGSSLMHVAVACGFADQQQFSRIFHRKVGIAPRVFRDHI